MQYLNLPSIAASVISSVTSSSSLMLFFSTEVAPAKNRLFFNLKIVLQIHRRKEILNIFCARVGSWMGNMCTQKGLSATAEQNQSNCSWIRCQTFGLELCIYLVILDCRYMKKKKTGSSHCQKWLSICTCNFLWSIIIEWQDGSGCRLDSLLYICQVRGHGLHHLHGLALHHLGGSAGCTGHLVQLYIVKPW